MSALNTAPTTMCTSISGVLSYIKEHARALKRSMSIHHDLEGIMDEIVGGKKISQDTITALHNILHRNDEVETVVLNRKLALMLKYQTAHQDNWRWKDKPPFRDTDTYKQVIANQKLLEKLFTKHDFLKTGEYAIISRALADSQSKRSIIEGLLQYDKLDAWGESGLPTNQRFGYKEGKKYRLTTNEITGKVLKQEVEAHHD